MASPVAGSGGTEVPAPVGNGNWISYGNGPRNWFTNLAETKISVESAKNLKVAWTQQPGEITGPPAVVGDRLFVTSGSGFFGLKVTDGSMIWRNAATATSAPAYDEAAKLLYVLDRVGRLHAVSPDDGTDKWVKPVTTQGGAQGWSSPVVVGNAVVVGIGAIDMGTFKGGIAAFDKMTGDPLWSQTQARTAGSSIWSGPGGDETDGMVYAGSGNSYGSADEFSDSLFAVSLSKGERMWNKQMTAGDGFTLTGLSGGPDHDFGTNPIVLEFGGRKLLAAGQKSGKFWVVDRGTGQVVWDFAVGMRSNAQNGGILNNGAFDGKRFIVAANEGGAPGKVYGLDPDPEKSGDARVLWKRDLDALVWAPITAANGVCFVPVGRNMWVINCATGEDLHPPFSTPTTIACGASISNGRVFFGSGFTYPFGGTPGRLLTALSVE